MILYTFEQRRIIINLLTMKKKHQKFQLAIAYSRHPSQTSFEQLKQSLPSTAVEQECEENYTNIFADNIETRLRKLQLQADKKYDIVGFKEVQQITSRINRKKCGLQLGTKNTKLTDKSVNQKASFLKNSGDYLTKDEIIQYCSPSYITSARMTRDVSVRAKSPQTDSKTVNQSVEIDTEHKKVIKKQHFSLSRLKKKMEEYQEGWKLQVLIRKKLLKRTMKHTESKNSSSIIESVDQYRILSECKDKQAKKQKNRQLRPQFWQRVLRNSINSNSSSRQPEKLQKNGLKSKGNNKYLKQLLWLQEKDSNGYFFKKDKSLRQLKLLN